MEQQLTFDGAPPVRACGRRVSWDEEQGLWRIEVTVERFGHAPSRFMAAVPDVISLAAIDAVLTECEATAWLWGGAGVRAVWRRGLKSLQGAVPLAEAHVPPRVGRRRLQHQPWRY